MDQSFSVGDFIQAADEAVALIHSRNKIPIISGGTAFYVKHFLYGLSEAPPSDEEVRARVTAVVEEKGLAWAHNGLRVDPVSAKRIHPNDTYRITRAPKCMNKAGNLPFSTSKRAAIANPVLIIGLERERQDSLDRLKRRIGQMEADGPVEEIRSFRQGRSTWPSMAGIGIGNF